MDMNRRIKLVAGVAAALVLLLAMPKAWAHPEFARQTKAACATCHANPAGGVELTAAGTAFKADGKAPAAGTLTSPAYVGSKGCACHFKETAAWKKTKHANALALLAAGDPKAVAAMATALKVDLKGAPDKNDACVRCHVTGFQLAGGYPGADSLKTAGVAYVECEACHGPGGKHIKAAAADKKTTINATPTAGTCMGCHTPATSPKFNFEVMKKLVHPVAAG
jgi:hypothetical protein